jgi:hypothetical protein
MQNRERVGPLPHSWDAFMPEPLFPGGLIIKDSEVEIFLFWGAKLIKEVPCQEPDCPRCENACRFWWDWCNSLHGANRIRVQRELKARGIPLPPHPGDDIEPTV